MGSEDFKQNHTNYGWKQVPWEQRQPGNAVLIVDDSGTAKHTMMYDSDNAQGQPLFNHSNGGHDTEKNLVTGRSLAEYHRLDNEQGGNHTEDHYFRYRLPNEYWLPEIVVTPKK